MDKRKCLRFAPDEQSPLFMTLDVNDDPAVLDRKRPAKRKPDSRKR